MMRTLVLFALLLLSAALCAASEPVGIPVDTNLAPDPGFEEGARGWRLDQPKWQVVSSVRASGSKSLRISNDDPKSYTLVSAPVPCMPNGIYRYGAKVKTENVQGMDSGATIALEWYNASGVYLGGDYPAGVKGTNDWTQLSFESKMVPVDASTLRVVVYLRKECTGTAWFDDVSVELTARDIELTLRPVVRYPRYRETIYPGMAKRINVGVEAKGNREHRTDTLAADVSVVGPGGKVIAQTGRRRISEKSWEDLSLDLADSQPGEYRIVTRLLDDASGRTLKRAVNRLTIAGTGDLMPKVYIDEHGRCIADGKLFFPLGLYVGEGPTLPKALDDLDRLADSEFNCLMMYGVNNGTPKEIGSYLDAINDHGLRIIYSVKDLYPHSTWETKKVGEWQGVESILRGVVSTFRDHPAVLAWYLNDELSKDFLPIISEHYDTVRRMDSDHPIWQVLYYGQQVRDHVSSSDVIGIDNYPVPSAPVTMFYRSTDEVRNSVMNARGIWMVPQASSLEAYAGRVECRHPTFEEVMCMSYMGLIHGARGLVYYSLFDLKRTKGGEEQWLVMKRAAEELMRIRPIILGLDLPSERGVSSDSDKVHVLTRDVDGSLCVLATNPEKEAIKTTFKLGPEVRASSVEIECPGAPTRTAKVVGGAFADEIESYGIRVYRLKSP